jgi:hypothetical protein
MDVISMLQSYRQSRARRKVPTQVAESLSGVRSPAGRDVDGHGHRLRA